MTSKRNKMRTTKMATIRKSKTPIVDVFAKKPFVGGGGRGVGGGGGGGGGAVVLACSRPTFFRTTAGFGLGFAAGLGVGGADMSGFN
jgi:hypothetical protein